MDPTAATAKESKPMLFTEAEEAGVVTMGPGKTGRSGSVGGEVPVGLVGLGWGMLVPPVGGAVVGGAKVGDGPVGGAKVG